jgi:hypothetical protein
MPPAVARKADVRKVRAYERRRPKHTLLYQLIEEHYPRFLELLATQGRSLPEYVQREFEDFLKCGRLEHGFLRAQCQDCHSERLVAFSCKRRGFCPSCGARRMVESAALLVDEVLPHLPMRQWVLSFPFQLRFLFASRPEIMSRVLGLVYRAIETHLIQQAGGTRATAKTGAVTLIQRFGSALNLNIHFTPLNRPPKNMTEQGFFSFRSHGGFPSIHISVDIARFDLVWAHVRERFITLTCDTCRSFVEGVRHNVPVARELKVSQAPIFAAVILRGNTGQAFKDASKRLVVAIADLMS